MAISSFSRSGLARVTSPSNAVIDGAATGTYTDGGFTYNYYTFTGNGSLTVNQAGFADVLIVGGGGSGGSRIGGGGGAGGHLYTTNAYLPAGSLTVTVGAGGAGVLQASANSGRVGNNGSLSRLDSYFSPGGGAGSSATWDAGGSRYGMQGLSGGSGGGAGGETTYGGAGTGGSGFSGLGNNGGSCSTSDQAAGGGGGAGGAGGNASSNNAGNGGAGLANSITGSSVTRAGGGGGSGTGTQGSGGSGGGGAGAKTTTAAGSGTANTGGGGGGHQDNLISGNGGSGIVIVRVKV